MFSICHVTLEDYVTKGSCDYIAKFKGHRYCGSGDIMVLVFHVVSQEHVIKGSYDFMAGSPSWLSHHPVKLGGLRYCVRGDIVFLVFEKLSISEAYGMLC